MTKYEKCYSICKKFCDGQEFPYLEYDRYIKSPKIWDNVIESIDDINGLYQYLYKLNLPKIMRTEKGSIAKWNIHHAAAAWDCQMVITPQGVFKGIIITVICLGTVFIFKAGSMRNVDGVSGWKAYSAWMRAAKKLNIDMTQYEVDNGEQVKSLIESPIVYNYVKGKELEHVHHMDINAAWPSEVCKEFPELIPVVEKVRTKGKLFPNAALGFMQSKHCDYKYSALALIGINGCNKTIRDYEAKLWENDFEVIGINTDGIWYRDLTGNNRVFHDELEGKGLGQWKNDHIDCTFYAHSDGQYYFIEDGKFNVRARGLYRMDTIKKRDLWTKEDFHVAMSSVLNITFEEGVGFIIHET